MRMRNPKYMNDVIKSCDFLLDENLFANNNPICMEIGMGKGDFILNMALENPHINYIGVEKYSSVASIAIKKIQEYYIRLVDGQKRDLTEFFEVVACVWVLDEVFLTVAFEEDLAVVDFFADIV